MRYARLLRIQQAIDDALTIQHPYGALNIPKRPTQDPDYRLIKRTRGRYTHYYFYIRDEVLGPLIVCVGSFLPFQTTYYLNGHHFILGELQRAGVAVRRDDNAFLATGDAGALQAAADRLSPAIIRKRLDYWTGVVGPKFSAADRAGCPTGRTRQRHSRDPWHRTVDS